MPVARKCVRVDVREGWSSMRSATTFPSESTIATCSVAPSGGVISSVLDVVGGLVAFIALLKREGVQSLEDEADKFSRLGTIDLRVDYLRPGLGKAFFAKGFVLRAGRKVAVTRMELHNDEESLIAVGTGAYSIS